MKFFLGVDVGTGSARAGLFDFRGKMLASAKQDIRLWKPQPDFAEQSSDDIWAAVCRCVRAVVAEAKATAVDIAGIGFDATCSLVAVDTEGKPVSISPTGNDAQNVIVWMDHRAIPQADRINAGQYEVLRYVGGVISPEMETPKLLWLKENLPATWRRAACFFDLPDFLTWRATGDETRSLCSTVCKWTYLGRENRWDDNYFRAIGLGDLADEGYRRIGVRVRPIGEPVGRDLSAVAAKELGLTPGTAVGVSIIDAHAGGVGLIGAALDGEATTPEMLEGRLALIGGTSSCHMAVTREAKFIPGVWGPYYSAMVPGMWLAEGGQSATGSLIDFVIQTHGANAELQETARTAGRSVYEVLNDRLDALAVVRGVAFPAALTDELHVCPYFHGNRSPRANPTLRGMITGLKLSATLDDLARLYMATVQAVAYGTRHIISEMNRHGYRIETVLACGGGTKNPVFLREHADITGCRLVLPREPEAVLLGAAILGAVAAGQYRSVMEAMAAMSEAGRVIKPVGDEVAQYHRAKYEVFLRLYEDQMVYRKIMTEVKI